MQKRNKDTKIYVKVPSRKMTRLIHARPNIFNSLTNPNNQSFPEFVMLNKKATFEKLDGQVFDKIKFFRKKGFLFCCLNFLAKFL